jgi:hypothetical protein
MKIFLSYRRADSQVTAGRMAQFLDGLPAVEAVFLDVDDIGIGENYEDRIRRTLAQASHVFLLIGPQWAGPTEGAPGRARIFDADDVVRQETRIALRSEARLVPVLIDEARMPRASELPDDLKKLPAVQAFVLRTPYFDEDMDDLLDGLLGKTGRGSRWRLPSLTPAGIALRALAGLATGAALLLGLGMANRYLGTDCYDLACRVERTFGLAGDADAMGLLSVLAIGVLVVAALAPFLIRRLRRRR